MTIDQAAQSPKSNRSPTWPKLPFHIPWAEPIWNHPRSTARVQLGVRRSGAGVRAPAPPTCIIRRPPMQSRQDGPMPDGGQSARRRRGPHER
ncbi:hypothetical protein SORBI_3001G084166 [Sorghum bicolor]|uniref:Uncharacterized protein n=1 Tax=Sorghum bicolor TaxID=4558 RepID=A0A1Z5S4U8_SORBI|nr:hypothetical protein SORBI_3001G084166 [Sorghum bicolor]